MTEPFFGNFDLASLALWLFYGFFALLIFYIQRENMREGYPLEDDDGNEAANQGPFPLPEPKTFKMNHGRPDVTVPDYAKEGREVALKRTGPGQGFPLEPTGDPMLDGVGPAAWAPRADAPELDARGHAKIQPMAKLTAFHHAAGRDPRGLPVMAGDNEIVGTICDMWIDEPEQMVRYLEIALDPSVGTGTRLVPLTLARIGSNKVKIRSIFGKHFDNVPKHKSDAQVTMLEEEKICAYYGGGKLYASQARQDPQI